MNPLYQATESFPFLSGMALAFLFPVLVLVAVWTIAIKGLALWHAARNGQKLWFIVLLVVNTLGILEVVYLVGFRKDKQVLVIDSKPVASEA